jgi:hypothetical protein
MFSRLLKYLVLASCSAAGIACSHQQGSTCSGTVEPANPHSCSCAGKSGAASTPVVDVKVMPNGETRTYVIIGSTPCSTCKATTSECSKCKTVKDAVARAVPTPSCNKCQAAKNAVVASPAPGCSSCQTAKGLPTQPLTQTPRPLDRSVADGHLLTVPPQTSEPHVVAKPEGSSLPNEVRDPVTGLIRYDHARDYSWVVGKLEYLHAKHQWRVRYAPYDVDDELGGVVALTGVEHLSDKLRSGVTVRIQGNLVHPESRKASPEYYVYDLKSIE